MIKEKEKLFIKYSNFVLIFQGGRSFGILKKNLQRAKELKKIEKEIGSEIV